MNTYQVKITRSRTWTINVEADNKKDAVRKAHERIKTSNSQGSEDVPDWIEASSEDTDVMQYEE